MARPRPFASVVLALAAGGLCLPAPAVAPRDEERLAEERFAASVSWEELVADPAAHLGRSVRVVLLVAGEASDWNAYVTRFGQARWRAWDAWSDLQEPWLPEAHRSPAARVWARRDGGAAWALARARPGARVELRLRVHEVFLGAPWCEVEAVVPCVEELGEGTLIHAARGVEERQAGRHELAALAFEEALKAPLPARARAAIEGLRDESRRLALARR